MAAGITGERGTPGMSIEREAPALRAHRGGDAVRGGKAVDGAAGEHDRVHRVDQVFRRQRIGLARAGSAAAHVDARTRRARPERSP